MQAPSTVKKMQKKDCQGQSIKGFLETIKAS
jgi:hypothetical protein